jgi:hypothetical protein
MICPFPPGGFLSVEVPLLSVSNDLSRGLQFFSVGVVVVAALVVLPAAAVVSSLRLLRRVRVGIGLVALGCLAGCTRTAWSGQCGTPTTGCEQEKSKRPACLGWNCER